MVSRLLRVFALLFGLVALSGCMGSQITDFSDRSVVYGWVDLSQAAGNRVTGGTIRGYNLPPNSNLYPIGATKLGDGYVFYHFGVESGPVKLNTISAMTCVGLCGNTINVYDFGKQGREIGAAVVRSKGTYYLGSYGLKTKRTLFFGPSDFQVYRTSGPSRRQMLETILKDAPDAQKPLIQQAINRL